MPQIDSQLKLKVYDGFGGNFIDSDYLAASWDGGKPHIFEGLMGKIFTASDRFNNKPLLGMTLGSSKIKEIDNEIYRWNMHGAEEKVLRIVENLEAANTTPGVARTTFRVKLDEDWFAHPDVLFPEDNEYPLAVMEGPVQEGNGYIYHLKLQTDDDTKFLPPEYLEEGREFSKVWTSVSNEYNEDFGTLQHASSFQLESQVSAFAQKVTITDKAMREGGRLGIPIPYRDRNGKTQYTEKFMPYIEAKLKDELYMSMEAQLMYGKRHTAEGKKGYWLKTGPGLREQLQDGHIEFYSGVLTEGRLIDYLLDIYISRVNEGERKITAMTGTAGSIIFHDLLASSAGQFFTVDTHFIEKIKSNPRHLSYGAQFTHYQGPEGIEVTVVKNPMYDDFKYSPKAHPTDKKFPIDSFRFTFLDFGSSSDESNIQFLRVKDTYRNGYTVGTVGPSGPIMGGQAGSLVAGYDTFCEGTAGLWMKDVTRGGEIILDAE